MKIETLQLSFSDAQKRTQKGPAGIAPAVLLRGQHCQHSRWSDFVIFVLLGGGFFLLEIFFFFFGFSRSSLLSLVAVRGPLLLKHEGSRAQAH